MSEKKILKPVKYNILKDGVIIGKGEYKKGEVYISNPANVTLEKTLERLVKLGAIGEADSKIITPSKSTKSNVN